MCSPSAPPTPDYAAAAAAQGAANLESAVAQGHINNPNVIGPTGTQTTTWDGNNPTVTQTLSPAEQAIYDQNARNRLGLGNLAGQGTEALQGLIGTKLDLSGLPSAPGSAEEMRKSVMDAMLSRSNTDIGNQESAARSNLIAAGIPVGSVAYNNEMDKFQRSRNDARNQAELSAGQEASRNFGMDSDARKAALSELLTQRQTPLNEITALTSGSQVSNPFSTPGYAQNGTVAPAPVFAGAQAQGQYNMDAANQQSSGMNALLGAGARLGAAYIGSDVRWKSNIVKLGTHKAGMGWYEYDIDGIRTQGVMAQEARLYRPEAIYQRPDGYLMVNYEMLEN